MGSSAVDSRAEAGENDQAGNNGLQTTRRQASSTAQPAGNQNERPRRTQKTTDTARKQVSAHSHAHVLTVRPLFVA